MGNVEARQKRRGSSLILQEDDLNTIERQYNAMCAGHSHIDKRAFEKFAEKYLDSELRELVFDSIMKLSKTKKITLNSFVQFAEETLHSAEQQAKWLLSFGLPLRTILDCVVASFFVCEQQGCYSSDRALLVDYLLVHAPPEPATFEGVHQWLKCSAVLQMMLNRVFDAFLLGRRKKALPFIGERPLLSAAALCLIVNYLPAPCRYQWTHLYTSEEHGLNFEKLSKAINGVGACLIVIETNSGRTFGGFANAGFLKGDVHRGDNTCFLFEDHHSLAIHTATDENDNFAYLNWNHGTLPNGLGLGGHGKHWCFFITTECTKGLSSPNINTFENCWLAGENEFAVKKIEAWRIGRDIRVRFDTIGDEIVTEEGCESIHHITLKNEDLPHPTHDGVVEQCESRSNNDPHF
uniref:MTOR-associated protein MEAK7 n=1 Tax=Ascaris suum TaxID=6253 RepID=F1L7B9_ASCSU